MPLLVALVVVQSALASPIQTSSGRVMRWALSLSSPNLNYYIDPALGTNYSTWATAGFALWAAAPESYVTFSSVGTEAAADIVVKGYPAISSGLVPMQAAPRTNTNGNLTRCEVQITIGSDALATYATSAGQQYLQSSVYHEIGHCLGLTHSLVINSVMSYRSNSPLALATDDRFALSILYPQDGDEKYPLGCATLEKPSSNRPNRRGPQGADPRLLETLLLLAVITVTYAGLRRPRLRNA